MTKDPTEYFWQIADEFLALAHVSKGKLMGFPCLRINGDFFATAEHKTGDLIVKMDKDRVAELIVSKNTLPFAPAGRVFKEWARIPQRDKRVWTKLLKEAMSFVAGE